MTGRPETHLDIGLLRKWMLFFGGINLLVAPLTPDPVSYGAGACAPVILLSLVNRLTMPKGIVFFLLWQWAQVFARALQSFVDGESMSLGLYAPNVMRAYWYSLFSLLTFAVVFRLVLQSIRLPTLSQWEAHERWRQMDLLYLYLGSIVASAACTFMGRFVPGLDQPLVAASQVKAVALFLLCGYTFTTGKGVKILLVAVFFEILVGFTGFLSDFRAVFVFIAIAALAARIRWTVTASIAGVVWITVLLTLALFWTSVKAEYRDYVTGSDEMTQAIRVPLGERMSYLGDKALNIGDMKWGDTAYMLLLRFAYIDIFAQVIGVSEVSPEPTQMRQWRDALSHVLQPRFLFPDKPPLSDSEVFMRLTRADPMEQVRTGTSISVGYMAENFVDLGFPGMLAGIAVLGFIFAIIAKYFMQSNLPWLLREGIVMGLAYMTASTGMEISIPKLLGALVMYFIVWALMVKYIVPPVMRWLDHRAQVPEHARNA
ncbi:hypothetical protein [Reyranella sp.]|uniref:hypothetical protein n=1 Tax=Reyranella sp. TaxID=1929291 RepID=UPI003BAAC146